MKLRNLFKKTSIRKVLVGLSVLAAVAVPIVVSGSHAKAGYGPTRTRVYDWNKPADQVGATTPTFNSFINTPVYGDERNFTRIAPVVSGQSPLNADYSKENVTANANSEYWVRVYVHNDANQSLNDAAHNFVGVATNAKVRIAIADGQANGVDVMGYITADNAVDKRVWDSGTLVNDTQKFSVTYEQGSAEIFNQAHQNGMTISDNIVSANGTSLGYDQMDGSFPGCFEHSAYVFVKVKVNTPNVQIAKTAREVVTNPQTGVKTGTGTFTNNLAVKPGDLVSFQLATVNTGTAQADNVTIRDSLPKGLTLDSGSITYVSSAFPSGEKLADTDLSSGGANVGSFAPKGNGTIFFRAVVGQPVDDTCKIVNTAYVHAGNSTETSDMTTLTFDHSLCEHKNVVSYSCDLLVLVQDKTNSHNVTVTVTAGHDTTTKVTSYVIDFGDGSTPITTNTNPYTYTYAKDGTFNVVAKVNFTLADTTSKNNVAGDKCIGSVKTTTTPTSLPNTGAGGMIATFIGASFLGAFLYRMRALRAIR
jgi:uncharacterized repeat protein (TIGR01451 family)